MGPKVEIHDLKMASETVTAFLFGRAETFVNLVNASVMTSIHALPLLDLRMGP